MPAPRIRFPCPSRLTIKTISPLTTCRNCLAQQLRPCGRLPPSPHRTFTSTPISQSWLFPKRELRFKDRKGRPRVPTGGSTRGTTVIWGDYGLRLKDHDRRIPAYKLKNGEDVIRQRLRGTNYRLFTRITASTAVYKKGNETRMGTGKGKFDHWACRLPVSRVVFELSGDCHEQVMRDALRLAANKMPGMWEFVRKGDPPVMGITKLSPGALAEDLKRPRKNLPLEQTTHRLPGAGQARTSVAGPSSF